MKMLRNLDLIVQHCSISNPESAAKTHGGARCISHSALASTPAMVFQTYSLGGHLVILRGMVVVSVICGDR